MKSRRTGPFSGFAGALADRGLRGRWLWAIPAAGLAARRLISGVLDGGTDRGAASVVAGLAVTLLVTAAFAELWLAGDELPDPARGFKAVVLFLLPYPALLLLGGLSAQALTFVASNARDAGGALDAFIVADLAMSKIAAMAITLLSALALARWKRGRGALESLVSGWRVLKANVLFIAALAAATWGAQELLSVGFSFWRDAAAGASPETFGLARIAQDYLVVAASLVGCVAAPIEAFRSGRLVEP